MYPDEIQTAENTPAEAISQAPGDAVPAGAEDLSRTQAFSRRLKEVAARQLAESIGQLGLTGADGDPVRSREALAAWQQRMNEERAGLLARQNADAESLARMERELLLREQAAAFRDDPDLAPFFQLWEGRIGEMVRAEGCDLQAAFAACIQADLPGFIREMAENLRRRTAARLDANAAASPGALGDGGDEIPPDAWSLSPGDFARRLQEALSGQLRG